MFVAVGFFVAVAVAKTCPDWPALGDRFEMGLPIFTAWKRYVEVRDNVDSSKWTTVFEKQCVSFRTDLNWLQKDAEETRIIATDDKTKFCGDLIRVYDCEDYNGELLFTIVSDTCVTLKTYEISRGEPSDDNPVQFTVQQAVPNILWGTWNFTINGTETYAQAELVGVLNRAFDVRINQTVAERMTSAQRNEATGLFAIILATRMLQTLEDNDNCSSFMTFGIPTLVFAGCFCLVAVVAKLKSKR